MTQQLRPEWEQKLEHWQREALDRERSRPRDVNDVMAALLRIEAKLDALARRALEPKP